MGLKGECVGAKAVSQAEKKPGVLSPAAAALALAVVLMIADLARAQSVKPEDQVPVAKRWSVIAGLGQSQNLYITNSGREQAATDFSGSLRFRLAPKTLLSASVAASYDNKYEESDFTQAALSLSQSQIPILNEYLLWTPSGSAQLPASRVNHAASMRGVLGFSNRFDVNSEKMGWTRASVAYLASVSHAIYEYETATSGAINQPWRVSQGLEFTWALSDRVYLVLFGSHGLRRSMQGNWSESLTHAEEVYAQVTAKWGLSLGHQLGSSIRTANGQDLNLRMNSDQDSIVYLQSTLIF